MRSLFLRTFGTCLCALVWAGPLSGTRESIPIDWDPCLEEELVEGQIPDQPEGLGKDDPEGLAAEIEAVERASPELRLELWTALLLRFPGNPTVLTTLRNEFGSSTITQDSGAEVRKVMTFRAELLALTAAVLRQSADEPKAIEALLELGRDVHSEETLMEWAEQWRTAFPRDVGVHLAWLGEVLDSEMTAAEAEESLRIIAGEEPEQLEVARELCDFQDEDDALGPIECLEILLSEVEGQADESDDTSARSAARLDLRALLASRRLEAEGPAALAELEPSSASELFALLSHLTWVEPESCSFVVESLHRFDPQVLSAADSLTVVARLSECLGTKRRVNEAGDLLIRLVPRIDLRGLRGLQWRDLDAAWSLRLRAVVEERLAGEEPGCARLYLKDVYMMFSGLEAVDPQARLDAARRWAELAPAEGKAWSRVAGLSEYVHGAAEAQAVLVQGVAQVEERRSQQNLLHELLKRAAVALDFEAAEQAGRELLRLAEGPDEEAAALSGLATVAVRQGREDKALGLCRRLVPLAIASRWPGSIDDRLCSFLLTKVDQVVELMAYLEVLWELRRADLANPWRILEAGEKGLSLDELNRSDAANHREHFFADHLVRTDRLDLALPYLEQLALERPGEPWVAEWLAKAKEQVECDDSPAPAKLLPLTPK